ncbi:hypothetical protein QA789_26670 [Streptomyces sp. B21-088]
MDAAWFDYITAELGSDYGAYEYVMNIGFAAWAFEPEAIQTPPPSVRIDW